MGEEFFYGVLRLCPVYNFIVFRNKKFLLLGVGVRKKFTETNKKKIKYKNCIVLYRNYFVPGFSKEMVVKSPQGQMNLLPGVFFVHGDEE